MSMDRIEGEITKLAIDRETGLGKGFGFIKARGMEYFFHRSALDRLSGVSYDDLRQGQRVSFVPTEGEKGLRAEEVQVL